MKKKMKYMSPMFHEEIGTPLGSGNFLRKCELKNIPCVIYQMKALDEEIKM